MEASHATNGGPHKQQPYLGEHEARDRPVGGSLLVFLNSRSMGRVRVRPNFSPRPSRSSARVTRQETGK